MDMVNLEITRDELKGMTKEDINTLLLQARPQWSTVHACIRIIAICDNVNSIFGHGRMPIADSTKLEAAMRGKILMGLSR
jgi:hypothetical protein